MRIDIRKYQIEGPSFIHFLHGPQGPSYKYKSNLESWYMGQLFPINVLVVKFHVGRCWSLFFFKFYFTQE